MSVRGVVISFPADKARVRDTSAWATGRRRIELYSVFDEIALGFLNAAETDPSGAVDFMEAEIEIENVLYPRLSILLTIERMVEGIIQSPPLGEQIDRQLGKFLDDDEVAKPPLSYSDAARQLSDLYGCVRILRLSELRELDAAAFL